MENASNSQQLTIEQALSRAKKAIKKGNSDAAAELYNAILQQHPNHPIAKKRLRKLQKNLPRNQSVQIETTNPSQDQISSLVKLYKSGQMLQTEQACRELLQTCPQSLVVINVLGAALQGQGKLQEAVTCFDKAIQLKPDFAEAYDNRGIVLQELGKSDEALQSYDKAIQIRPDFTAAHSNRGNVLKDLGKYEEAIVSYEKAIRLKPDYAEAYSNYGNALIDLGQLQKAVASFEKAVQLKPDYAEAYCNRGAALKDLDQLQEAVTSYDKAIQIKPDFAEAFNNRGVALEQLEHLDEALWSCDKAIKLKPDFAEAHSNRGNVLQSGGQLHEAVASYDKAIQHKHDYVEAYSNRGNALKHLSRLTEAMASYEMAIRLEPNSTKAFSNLLMALNYTSSCNSIERRAIARKFGDIVTEKAQVGLSAYQYPPMPTKLRVGFVSGDLRSHPVGFFLESILSAIDPTKIELIAYPTTPKVDALSERIKPSFSNWKPIYRQKDEDVAKLILADGIHILFDLSGHTAENRLSIFAYKPAPVQVSWLGYFATTGLKEMDYLLGDPYVTPPEEDEQFTEKVWRLPETRWCFTSPSADVEVSKPPALKQDYITFGCFNNLSKINDRVVKLWAKILEATPNSRLLIKNKQFRDLYVRESAVQRFAALGLDSNQIILEGPEDRQSYFAAYNRVDIALDPFPFTGGTTSVEGLWMGVPFVTLAGDSLVSRQGVGVLMNAGLPDWIADDEEDYLAKAILFASDLDKLAKLRADLRSQVLASPLFDAPRFARSFEHALLDMWNQWDIKRGNTETTEKDSQNSQTAQVKTANPTQDQFDALVNLYHSGQLGQAEQASRKLLQTYPQSLATINVLGATLQGQGKLQEAVASFEKAIQLKPDFAEAYYNRGNALKDLDQLQEAIASYDQAIKLKPDYVEAYSNRGTAQKNLGQLDRAVASYNKAIQLKPEFAMAYSNRGNALQDLCKLQEAVESFEKAIQLQPDFAEAYYNLGKTLKEIGLLDEALENYEKAIRLKPDFAVAYNSLLMGLNYTPNHSAIERLAIAREFGEIVTGKAQIRFSTYICPPMPTKLRIGFVSGDLRNHSVGHFLENVLSSIDSSKLELYAYPTTPKVDDLTERMKPSFSHWKPIYCQTDEDVAKLIHTDGIHVLLDLSGHTEGNRLPVFAYKPAPVQVSWLGYFATTGLDEMDYVLGDPYVTPPEEDEQFTEKVWRLPETRWCFTPPNVDVEVTASPALKQRYVTFGCFNNFSKLNDKVVVLWAKVLKAIPDSQLLLKNKQFRDPSVRESIIQKFTIQGINSEQIILEGPEDRQSYFTAYNRVDITLDPHPFTGGTTSVESLWMGVPLITLAGDSLVSRQGVGILMNAGLPDWIADDEEEYLAKAVLFASDFDKLAKLRSGLRSQVLASPLFDASRFARNFEQALLEIWDQKAHQS